MNILMSKFVVDIDGIIATSTEGLDYTKSLPIKENIAFFNHLYDINHIIVYFTARGSETGIDWKPFTESQLIDWGVKYHKLLLGKPSADYYIDDKFVSLENLKEELKYEVYSRIRN